MKSEPPSVRGKTRTREHVLADLSINHVERQVLLCGFSVDRVQHDYGYDLSMATYSQGGEYEPAQQECHSQTNSWRETEACLIPGSRSPNFAIS